MLTQAQWGRFAIGGLAALAAGTLWYVTRINLYLVQRGHRRTALPDTCIPVVVQGSRITSRIISAFAVVTGIFVLLGWTLSSPNMVSLLPGRVAMNPVVAVCAVVCGLCLWTMVSGSDRARRIAKIAAGVVVVIALVKLVGFMIGMDTRVDQVLFTGRLGLIAGLPPNRMAPNTALALMLLALAICTIDIHTLPGRRPAELLAIAAGFIAAVGIVGYLYSVTSLYHFKSFIPMALHTAAVLGAMSVGVLLARPDMGLMSIVSSNTIGGMTARKLLPATIAVPVALGWLRIMAERSGHAGGDFGITLLIFGNIIFFVTLVFATAGLLRRSDIQRRQSEQTLSRERNLLRTLIDNVPDSIFIKDVGGRYITCNLAHARFAGVSDPDHIIGKTVFDLHPAEIAERYNSYDHAVMDTGQPLVGREEYIRNSHGDDQWAMVSKIPIFDSHGKVSGMVGITRDITPQKRAEQQREEIQNFLSSIIENIPNMVFVKDAVDLRFVRLNAAGEELIGHSRDEIVGKNDFDLFPPEEAEQFSQMDRSVLSSRKLLDIPSEPIQTAAGIRILHTKKIPIIVEGSPRYLLGISEDITEQIRAQEQLREQNVKLTEMAASERAAHEALKRAQSQMVQSEKLAALGQLVAGVAHEINNPLSFVSNNVAVLQRDMKPIKQLLEMYASADPLLEAHKPELLGEIRELSEQIDLAYTLPNMDEMMVRSRDGLKRIQQIVKDLRDFARLDESDLHRVDLNEGVASTINIVKGRAKSKQVTLDLELNPLPMVDCYPAKVNQVILNLVANAIDACKTGGRVIVRTARQENTDGIRVDVIDNGSGMSPEVRERIFDPFFTTKPQGEGTGLGLSISYGIIRDHKGTIEVDSTPGKGSTFTIKLPRELRSAEPAKEILNSEV